MGHSNNRYGDAGESLWWYVMATKFGHFVIEREGQLARAPIADITGPEDFF
jgi:hypothetical protein